MTPTPQGYNPNADPTNPNAAGAGALGGAGIKVPEGFKVETADEAIENPYGPPGESTKPKSAEEIMEQEMARQMDEGVEGSDGGDGGADGGAGAEGEYKADGVDGEGADGAAADAAADGGDAEMKDAEGAEGAEAGEIVEDNKDEEDLANAPADPNNPFRSG